MALSNTGYGEIGVTDATGDVFLCLSNFTCYRLSQTADKC